MKDFFGNLYRNTVLGYYLIHPFYLVYEKILSMISDESFIKWKFKRHMGYALNLQNPQSFNEKINWLKLNDRTDLHTIAADKYKVREYVASKIGDEHLVPLLFHTDNPRKITAENLPEVPFIIKTNHNSSGGIIVRDKMNVNWSRAQFDLSKLLRENYFYSSREWQYKNIEPRIVVERLLQDKKGNIPFDYKMHCFNGKLIFTQVDLDRQTNHTRNLYDVNWELIPCKWKYNNGRAVVKPKVFEKMTVMAEKIAQDFTYVRVDFYVIEEAIYFGELTFHSESGLGKFDPEHFDNYFGEKLSLPV